MGTGPQSMMPAYGISSAAPTIRSRWPANVLALRRSRRLEKRHRTSTTNIQGPEKLPTLKLHSEREIFSRLHFRRLALGAWSFSGSWILALGFFPLNLFSPWAFHWL